MTRIRREPLGTWGLVLGLLAACDRGEPTSRPSTATGRRAERAPGAEHTQEPVGAVDTDPPQQAERPTPERSSHERLALDLSACLRWGERRNAEGDVRLDLGTPSGAGARLGGWRSGLGRTGRYGGHPVAVATRPAVSLWLPAARRHRVLRLRLLSATDPQPTVYVGERAVAWPRVTPGRLQTIQVELTEGALTEANGELRLRVRGARALPGLGRTGLLIEWAELRSRPIEEGAPPMPVASMRGGELVLPEGAVLRCPLPRPEGRLRLRATTSGRGTATATLVEANGTRHLLSESPAGTPIDVEVPGAEGALLAVELGARGGEVRWRDARMVTWHEGEPRPADSLDAVRNVLVFLVDTLRADKLRPYEPASRVETPALQALAAESVLFERAHSTENWTKPSVASLLSGIYPWQHRTTDGDSVLPRTVRLLSERLRELGFVTAGFVANGYVSGKFGFRKGWGSWRNYVREGRRTKARFVADDVLAWLDRRPAEQPFFLYVQTIDPHVPYIPPDRILKRYDPQPYQGPVSFVRDRLLLEHVKAGKLRLGDRDRARLEALYDAEITYHDEHFARILQGLEERRLLQETLVVLVSDHGEEFFDHGSVGHGHSVYEELLHVPMLVRWPGATPRRITSPVTLADVAPTVFEALGRAVPSEMSGRSLAPLLRGTPEREPRVALSGFQDGWRVVLMGSHKLAIRSGKDFRYFDLRRDPHEQEAMGPTEAPRAIAWLRARLGAELDRHLQPASPPSPNARRTMRGDRNSGPRVHHPEHTDIDPQTEAQLRALGYVGGP